MSAGYEAKLGTATLGAQPPTYHGDWVNGPSDDFVVCLRIDGTPASRFGDVTWDFTTYHSERRSCRLNFAYWGEASPTAVQASLSREMRRVVFGLIWSRRGPALSLGTLGNYVVVLSAAAVHAESLGVQLGVLLGDSSLLYKYAANECSGWMCETLGSLLGVLANIGEEVLGFDVVSSKAVKSIRTLGRAYRAGVKQHAPMPTRIYSAYIIGLQQELSAWMVVANDVLALLQACGADPFMGRSYEQQRDYIAKKLGVDFASFEPRPTFEELCPESVARYLTDAGRDLNVKSLSATVGDIQVVCKLIVQTFTGMRDEEAASLPYYCLKTTVANGRTHFVVQGRTTKFNHGIPKRVQWVTNRDGHHAIEAARAIANAIYKTYDVIPVDADERRPNYPLFPSIGYLNLASQPMAPLDGRFLSGTLEFRGGSRVPARLFVLIEEGDIDELEQIDLHRAWRSENAYQIGLPWGFKTHQLRRSLALYAQRSGLVSLPSLRRQLQHLTEEMSRYYAKGSAFAKDFIGGEKDHFGLEWQNTQQESSALSYILNVLTSDDTLFGGHANWVQHRAKAADGTIVVDREATMRRFKKGEMAYKETLLGGCTSMEECDQVAIKWLSVDCLRDDCKNLVCNLSKLKRVVAAQEKFVSAIDQNSVEYRTEASDLKVLRSVMEDAEKRTAGAY